MSTTTTIRCDVCRRKIPEGEFIGKITIYGQYLPGQTGDLVHKHRGAHFSFSDVCTTCIKTISRKLKQICDHHENAS